MTGQNQEYTTNTEATRIYARQGVLAATAINSGALLATLSQASELKGLPGVACAFNFWAIGLAISTSLWLFAYAANNAFTAGKQTANEIWSRFGIVGFVAAIGCFIAGCLELSKVFLAVIP